MARAAGRGGGGPVPALYKRITPLTKASASLYGKFRGSKDSRIDILHALMARVGETLGVDMHVLTGMLPMLIRLPARTARASLLPLLLPLQPVRARLSSKS